MELEGAKGSLSLSTRVVPAEVPWVSWGTPAGRGSERPLLWTPLRVSDPAHMQLLPQACACCSVALHHTLISVSNDCRLTAGRMDLP